MTKKPAKIVRKTVSMPEELWEKVMKFRFQNRINSQAEAVEMLIRKGLGV